LPETLREDVWVVSLTVELPEGLVEGVIERCQLLSSRQSTRLFGK
jgi:hypothetical protein